MSLVETSTLRPGFLVSVKTSVKGNVKYNKEEVVRNRRTEDGKDQAIWKTERVIDDPAEHEAAIKARTKARGAVTGICSQSEFGMLCPEADKAELDKAVATARKIVDEFNATSKRSRIFFYVIAGRIAQDDVEAVRAINSEVRDLLADMEEGLKNLDVKTVRDAASKAKSIGAMLSPDAAARIQIVIDAARGAATKIKAAGEQAAAEIDLRAIRAVTEARTAFLDLDEAKEVKAPTVEGRAVDLMPSSPPVIKAAAGPAAQLEL